MTLPLAFQWISYFILFILAISLVYAMGARGGN